MELLRSSPFSPEERARTNGKFRKIELKSCMIAQTRSEPLAAEIGNQRARESMANIAKTLDDTAHLVGRHYGPTSVSEQRTVGRWLGASDVSSNKHSMLRAA